MTLRPSTRTYGALVRQVKRTFGDESGVQLEDADILAWANDAQQAIVTENKILKSRSTTATVVGQDTYDFPGVSIQQIESLHLDGAPLRNLAFADAEQSIMMSDPEKTQEGKPDFWYAWGGQFSLYPVPDDVFPITLFCTINPALLTGDLNETLAVPDDYYPAVVDYVLAKCYEMDEDWGASQAKEAQFQGALAQRKEEERHAAHMTYPVIIEVM
jgi:hypothetical protein